MLKARQTCCEKASKHRQAGADDADIRFDQGPSGSWNKRPYITGQLYGFTAQCGRVDIHVESFLFATDAATTFVRMMDVAQTKPPSANTAINPSFWDEGRWSLRIRQIGRRSTVKRSVENPRSATRNIRTDKICNYVNHSISDPKYIRVCALRVWNLLVPKRSDRDTLQYVSKIASLIRCRHT